MGKKTKAEVVDTNQNEGDIDPYASGVSLKNPEPNNTKDEGVKRGAEAASVAEVSKEDLDEQESVAKRRVKK